MIIKPSIAAREVHYLEAVLPRAAPEDRAEILMRLAGLEGEKSAAYFIDFTFGSSSEYAVIHDLRLEFGGRVAQIDHLVISRRLDLLVLESKSFKGGLAITETGEFVSVDPQGNPFSIESPLKQNERHVAVLRDILGSQSRVVGRFGVKLQPRMLPLVLVSTGTVLTRPRRFDTSKVMKADQIADALTALSPNGSIERVFAAITRMSEPRLQGLARKLVRLHRPIKVVKHRRCRTCYSRSLHKRYGPQGMYWKCLHCGADAMASAAQ